MVCPASSEISLARGSAILLIRTLTIRTGVGEKMVLTVVQTGDLQEVVAGVGKAEVEREVMA